MNATEKWQKFEKENNVKGWATSIAIHLLLLLAFILLAMKTPKDEPLQGVLIDFGNSATGKGQVADPGQTAAEPAKNQEAVAEAIEAASEPEVKPTMPDEVITQDVKEAPAITPQKEKPKPTKEEIKAAKAAEEAKKKAEAEAKAKAEAEAIAKAKAAEEARKKAEADALAESLNDAWGKGGSQGDKDGPGDFGNPDGVPNGGNDNGTGQGNSGSGPALSGLGGRKWVKLPVVNDNSQKFGTVVIKIKVDKSGNIISAEFTLKGSTTSDQVLIQRAKDALKHAKVSSNINAASEEIGYVTFNFRAQ